MEKLAIIVGLLVDMALFGGLAYLASKIGQTIAEVMRKKNNVNKLVDLVGITLIISLFIYQKNALALCILFIVFILGFLISIKNNEHYLKQSHWQKLIAGLALLIFLISYPTKIHYGSEVTPTYVEQRRIVQLPEELDGYYYINDSGEEAYQTITNETEIIYSKGVPYSYATYVVMSSYRQMWNDNSMLSIDYKTTKETYHHTLWIKTL